MCCGDFSCQNPANNDILSIGVIFRFYPHFTHTFPQVFNRKNICLKNFFVLWSQTLKGNFKNAV